MSKRCKCGSKICQCPECGKVYQHGEFSHCPMPECAAMNAPLDCTGCGFVVSSERDGVITYEMDLIPYES